MVWINSKDESINKSEAQQNSQSEKRTLTLKERTWKKEYYQINDQLSVKNVWTDLTCRKASPLIPTAVVLRIFGQMHNLKT